jgi:hypothetical protein
VLGRDCWLIALAMVTRTLLKPFLFCCGSMEGATGIHNYYCAILLSLLCNNTVFLNYFHYNLYDCDLRVHLLFISSDLCASDVGDRVFDITSLVYKACQELKSLFSQQVAKS